MEVDSTNLNGEDVLVFSCKDPLTKDQLSEFRNLIKGNLERAGLAHIKFIALSGQTDVKVLSTPREPRNFFNFDGATYAQAEQQFKFLTALIDKHVQERLDKGLPVGVERSADERLARTFPKTFKDAIDKEAFDKCEKDFDVAMFQSLRGRDCRIGVSSKGSKIYIVLAFPDVEKGTVTLCERYHQKASEQSVVSDLLNLASLYNVKSIAIEPAYNRMLLDCASSSGLPVVAVNQSWHVMSPAVKLLERLIDDGRLVHDGWDEFRESFLNMAFHCDRNGNKTPHRGQSAGDIEYAMATLYALAAMGESDSRL